MPASRQKNSWSVVLGTWCCRAPSGSAKRFSETFWWSRGRTWWALGAPLARPPGVYVKHTGSRLWWSVAPPGEWSGDGHVAVSRDEKLRAIRELIQLVIESEQRASGVLPPIPADVKHSLDDEAFLSKTAGALVARAEAAEKQLVAAEFGTAYALILNIARRLPGELQKGTSTREKILAEAVQGVLNGAFTITDDTVLAAITPAWATQLITDVSQNSEDRAIENTVSRQLKEQWASIRGPKPSWETIVSARAVGLSKDARDNSAIKTPEHLAFVLEKALSVRALSVREALKLTLEACEAPGRLQELVTKAMSEWLDEAKHHGGGNPPKQVDSSPKRPPPQQKQKAAARRSRKNPR